MLEFLDIQNFRLFQYLHIDELAPINLFVGKNNSGKTALLEALFLLFDQGQNFEVFPSIFRNAQHQPIDDFENFWTWLHYGRKVDETIRIAGIPAGFEHNYYAYLEQEAENITLCYYDRNADDEPRVVDRGPLAVRTIHREHGSKQQSPASLKVTAWKDWPAVSAFSIHPRTPAEDATLFNHVAIKRGGRQQLVNYLQKIEPQLQDLQYLQLGSQPLVYADVGLEYLIPITQMGQGFGRLLQIFSEVIISGSKILLIDEIENGLSYKAQIDLWQGLSQSLQETDIQIFATTHSYECIQAAYEVHASNHPSDFTLHRLERRSDNQIHIVTYNPTTLKTAMELDFEVRG